MTNQLGMFARSVESQPVVVTTNSEIVDTPTKDSPNRATSHRKSDCPRSHRGDKRLSGHSFCLDRNAYRVKASLIRPFRLAIPRSLFSIFPRRSQSCVSSP